MDNSNVFQLMFNEAIKSEPLTFKDFDRTKNIQDQLQEIVGDYKKCVEFLGGLLDPYAVIIDPYFGTFTSMEQLWLALVMHEKYGKVWDGQDWKII